MTKRKPTAWSEFDALTDADIAAAVRDDPGAAPLAGPEWFDRAVLVPPGKKYIGIRLDKDLLEWFKEGGRGYQTRINAVLRAYMKHRRSEEGQGRTGRAGPPK